VLGATAVRDGVRTPPPGDQTRTDVVAVFHSVALLRYDPVTIAELIVA